MMCTLEGGTVNTDSILTRSLRGKNNSHSVPSAAERAHVLVVSAAERSRRADTHTNILVEIYVSKAFQRFRERDRVRENRYDANSESEQTTFA